MRVEWQDDFKQLYKEKGQQKYGIRVLALWKVQEGMSESKVCELIGKTHKTIRKWRQTYAKGGVEALLMIQKGRGQKTRITKTTFEHDLNKLQEQKKGGRIHCQDVVDYIAKKHQLSYSRSGMYHLLHRFGFSWITSRSKHPKHNTEAIEAFKKTL